MPASRPSNKSLWATPRRGRCSTRGSTVLSSRRTAPRFARARVRRSSHPPASTPRPASWCAAWTDAPGDEIVPGSTGSSAAVRNALATGSGSGRGESPPMCCETRDSVRVQVLISTIMYLTSINILYFPVVISNINNFNSPRSIKRSSYSTVYTRYKGSRYAYTHTLRSVRYTRPRLRVQ